MRTLLVIALVVFATASSAQAQFLGPRNPPNYGPGYRGNISPYLNLLRGQNTGIDYYLGTRSEFQRRQDAAQFREDIDALDRRDTAAPTDEAPAQTPVQSGTPATFGSTLGYYNNRQTYIAPVVGRLGAGIGIPAPRGRTR
jgi:hypothetical protein